MRLLLSLLTVGLATHAQDFRPGDPVEYKAGYSPDAPYEPGVFVRYTPDRTQAILRQKPTQFFPQGSERAYNLNEFRRPQQPQQPQMPPKPQPQQPPQPATAAGLLTKDQVFAYAQRIIGPNPWGNPNRDAALDNIRDYIKANGTNFQTDLDFSNRMGAIGAYSVHISYAINANYGPAPTLQSYFGTWLLRAANRGSRSYSTAGGRPVVTTTDSQAESGQLTINPDGTYVWALFRNDPPAQWLRGRWRQAAPGEMHLWEGGPALWLLNAKQGADSMVRASREPGYATWIDVGTGKGRTPVEYGRRP
jgi:hypothetical protein